MEAQALATTCTHCGFDNPWDASQCIACGEPLGSPIRRRAMRDDEVAALENRYMQAVSDAGARGAGDRVRAFETAVCTARAVINMDIPFARTFAVSTRALYANYEMQVEAGTRSAADGPDDFQRRSVGATLFGSAAKQVVYAALSLDGRGLASYGPVSFTLKDIAVANRAALLDCNSYVLMKRLGVIVGDEPPPGYRCGWADKGRLAVAKLAGRIAPDTPEADFAGLLLESAATRADDEFIEVHIPTPVSLSSFERAILPRTVSNKVAKTDLGVVKKALTKQGIGWSAT